MPLSMRYRSWVLTRHRGGDDCSDLLRRFDKVRIDKVGVARRGAMPVMPEEPTDEGQTFARHNRLTCGGMAQVMQAQATELRIRADRAPASSRPWPRAQCGVGKCLVVAIPWRTTRRGEFPLRGNDGLGSPSVMDTHSDTVGPRGSTALPSSTISGRKASILLVSRAARDRISRTGSGRGGGWLRKTLGGLGRGDELSVHRCSHGAAILSEGAPEQVGETLEDSSSGSGRHD